MNKLLNIYNNKGICISKQITEEQYNIIKGSNKSNKIEEVLTLSKEGNKIETFEKFDFMNDISKEQRDNYDNPDKLVTSIYSVFLFGNSYYIVTENLFIIHAYVYDDDIVKLKDRHIKLASNYKIIDFEKFKLWGIAQTLDKNIQENVAGTCDCGITLFKFDDALDKSNISKSNENNNNITSFIKNLKLTEFKNSKFNCIHINLIINENKDAFKHLYVYSNPFISNFMTNNKKYFELNNNTVSKDEIKNYKQKSMFTKAINYFKGNLTFKGDYKNLQNVFYPDENMMKSYLDSGIDQHIELIKKYIKNNKSDLDQITDLWHELVLKLQVHANKIYIMSQEDVDKFDKYFISVYNEIFNPKPQSSIPILENQQQQQQVPNVMLDVA